MTSCFYISRRSAIAKERCDIITIDKKLSDMTYFSEFSLEYFCGLEKMPVLNQKKGPVLILSCPQAS